MQLFFFLQTIVQPCISSLLAFTSGQETEHVNLDCDSSFMFIIIIILFLLKHNSVYVFHSSCFFFLHVLYSLKRANSSGTTSKFKCKVKFAHFINSYYDDELTNLNIKIKVFRFYIVFFFAKIFCFLCCKFANIFLC